MKAWLSIDFEDIAHDFKREFAIPQDGSLREDALTRGYAAIEAFGAATGVPVLLNTSFNIREPIVTTPAEAIATFLRSDMDLLAIGGFLADRDWRRRAQGPDPVEEDAGALAGAAS